MTDKVIVLTGASRGLGAALAEALLAADTLLVTVSRKPNESLQKLARERGAQLLQIAADLSDPLKAVVGAEKVAAALPESASSYALINNAGMVQPLALAPQLTDGPAIASAFNLNVTAVILLTARFLATTEGRARNRRILNISSGAGRNPQPSWGVYCATKAALDMYTRVLNAEQRANGVRAVSLAPGVVDTDMQASIRNSDPARVPVQPRFAELHARGQLSAPAQVAARIAAYLRRDDFGQAEIDDIRNYD
ncbi:SDR family NAD(P)-dependent oxidoreductase [Orrella sp. JC864]|uniref:SDR family NAD(P)-dependent oxidoreductase n=1 Tax=Orrella sp. JC864 TaxID=3120298 RepID=UPI00300A52BE